MRRTSSGSDLSSSSLFAAPTAYVYMAPQRSSSTSMERQMTLSQDIELHANSSGGVVCPRRNDPTTGLPYEPYTIPCFTAEITGGLLLASHVAPPCLPADPIFHLPLGAITTVRVYRAADRDVTETVKSLDVCSRWSRLFCCWSADESMLVLDLDAPNGWLHHGTAGSPPGWAGPMLLKLLVRDPDLWIDKMGVRGLVDSATEFARYSTQRPSLNVI